MAKAMLALAASTDPETLELMLKRDNSLQRLGQQSSDKNGIAQVMSRLVAQKKQAGKNSESIKRTFFSEKKDAIYFSGANSLPIEIIDGYLKDENDLMTGLQAYRQREFNHALKIAETAIIYCENPVKIVSKLNKLFHEKK